jgi:hypothetical protein
MKAAVLKTWSAYVRSDERAWGLFLLSLSVVTHAYTITVTGDKFWFDSIAYFQLALSLFDADKLNQLYNSEFGFVLQHIVPGLPFLIRVLDDIFGEYLWPALATFQGLLGAWAVTWFVLAFRDKLSRRAQIAAIVICGLHPYFVSFDAAALTESVSASILLISLGTAIRALDGRLSLRVSLSLLLPLSIIAAQFRSYLGLVEIVVASLIVFQLGKPLRISLYGIIALALAAGTLAFPVYRAALGTGFFLPNVSGLMLTQVSYIAWDLDNETAQGLKNVVLNDQIRSRLVGKDPIDYSDAKHIFDDLVSSGMSPAQARQKIAAAAWRVRISSIGPIERQLQIPLASIGFQVAAVCCLPSRQIIRSMTAARLFSHFRFYFRWNSGVINGNGGNYIGTFDQFSEMTRSSHVFSEAAENFYIARIRPYVTDSLKAFRDPLRLTLLVSDPLIIVAWVGLFLFFWPGQRMALLTVFVPFAIIYAAATYAVTFDNRYSHPLVPIVIVGFVKAVDEFFIRGYWSRLRSSMMRSKTSA